MLSFVRVMLRPFTFLLSCLRPPLPPRSQAPAPSLTSEKTSEKPEIHDDPRLIFFRLRPKPIPYRLMEDQGAYTQTVYGLIKDAQYAEAVRILTVSSGRGGGGG